MHPPTGPPLVEGDVLDAESAQLASAPGEAFTRVLLRVVGTQGGAAGAAAVPREVPVVRTPLLVGAELQRCREYRLQVALSLSPPPSHTKWTRRVPHPVLIGHAASLTPY